MVIATFVRELDNSPALQRLYHLSEGVKYDDEEGRTEYIVVSAVVVPFSGPETYIFPSNEEGEILDWTEMPGSMRGTLNHEAAIINAGWEISHPPLDQGR